MQSYISKMIFGDKGRQIVLEEIKNATKNICVELLYRYHYAQINTNITDKEKRSALSIINCTMNKMVHLLGTLDFMEECLESKSMDRFEIARQFASLIIQNCSEHHKSTIKLLEKYDDFKWLLPYNKVTIPCTCQLEKEVFFEYCELSKK